jgi:pimeloyl-ACP methyl ester carboxylesterase
MDAVSRYVVANGLRHHLLEWDGGGKTTVLCLHGFLDLSWAFHRVGPALAREGHHVIAPDLRGHGQTERVGAGGYYHFMDYLLDVADLVATLGRDRLVLVGHSMGGGVAAYFAGAFPDRVWRAVVMEGMQLPETPLEAVPHRVVEWIGGVHHRRGERAARLYPSLEAAARTILRHDPLCPAEEARFLAEHATEAVDGTATGGATGFRFQHDPLHVTRGPYPFRLDVATAFWRAVTCPVLFVLGERSSPPADWPARVAAFRDARQVVIPGAGHMMMRHRPDEVASAIATFLRG